MIIDLNLQGKLVLIIGGGSEALKRIKSLLKQECKILVISNAANREIKTLEKNKKIILKKQKIQNTSFLSMYKPYMVITTTNDKKLNQKIIDKVRKKKILAYSSDSPENSDFANPAIIDFENIIQIAIFTGGKSPAISKKLRIQSEKIFKKIITKEEIGQIKIQKIVRQIAKDKIHTQNKRKEFLNSIIVNKEIKQLIKDGQLKKAEKRAITMMENWK